MLNRISVTPPAGAESLLFWKLNGTEVMSRSFSLNVTMLSQDENIDRKALLGKSLTVTVPTQTLQPRYFNGKITEVNLQGTELNGVRYAVYLLKIESDLWPLLRDRNLDGGDTVEVTSYRDTTINGTESHHVTGKLTETYDKGQDTTIGADGKTETILGGVVVNVNSGNWEQNVNDGTITIYSPDEINITSGTSVNINAPKALFQPKIHSLTITALSESATGNSLSLTGVSTSFAALSNSANLASTSFKLKDWSKTVFKAKTSNITVNLEMVKITNSVTNITNNSLFIIT